MRAGKTGETRYVRRRRTGTFVNVTRTLRALSLLAALAGLLVSAPASVAAAPNDPLYAQQWALPKIGSEQALTLAPTLSPVTVAVADGGVDFSNPDLAAVAWDDPQRPGAHGWDYVSGAPAGVAGDGSYWEHGTHVAGIIGAQRDNGVGIAGVAPNVRIMSLRLLAAAGENTHWDGDLAGPLTFAASHGVRVLNASYMDDSYRPLTCAAVERAVAEGILVVAAAGNQGTDIDTSPASPQGCPSAGLISVANSTATDALASSSNFGTVSVDLAAPGTGIQSSLLGSDFGSRSGTSMAAPQVAGAAAILFGLKPQATVGEVRQALLVGTDPLPALTGMVSTGGRLNLERSVRFLLDGPDPNDASAPTAPAPLAPGEGTEIVLTRLPDFSWTEAFDRQSGVDGYQLILDGRVVRDLDSATSSAKPADPLADGIHTWAILARNGSGLTAQSPTQTFTVEATPPPTPALLGPGDGAEQRSLNISLRWSDQGAGFTYTIQVDGSWYTPSGAGWLGLSFDEPGTHTWAVRVRDTKGRTSVSAPHLFTVGIAPPADPGAPVEEPVTGTPPPVWTPPSGPPSPPVQRPPTVKPPAAKKPVAKKPVAKKPVIRKPVAKKPKKKPATRKHVAKKPLKKANRSVPATRAGHGR